MDAGLVIPSLFGLCIANVQLSTTVDQQQLQPAATKKFVDSNASGIVKGLEQIIA